ncbi:coiled coil protein [Legionella nautarum]|uniref:Coiled coil protein n=2 Tax=Legionella nautarum TaxID=45070 RepID=A0A0W0WVD8_9GAMM|nr:coiled coil protein [Legionella nautarum]
MLQTLNKLSGAVAAAILYPIKSAILNTLVIFATFVVAVMLIVGLPILVAIKAYNTYQEDKLAFAIWSGLVIGVITTFVGIPLAIFIISVEALAAIADLTNNFIDGIREGYKEGLFFHVTNRFLYNYVGFSSFLTGIIDFVEELVQSSEQPVMDSNGFNKLFEEQQQEVEDFSLLSEEELATAQGKEQLKDAVAHYRELDARLTKLDEAVQKRVGAAALSLKDDDHHDNVEKITATGAVLYGEDGESLEDELMLMEIEQPILAVKLFEISSGQWRAVPGTTKIGDRTNLRSWVETNNSHPLTRERFDLADPHNGKNAKYVLVDYNCKKDARELVEAAKFIRKELNKREISLREAGSTTISHFNHQFTQLFFGDGQNDTAEEAVEPSSSSGYTPT